MRCTSASIRQGHTQKKEDVQCSMFSTGSNTAITRREPTLAVPAQRRAVMLKAAGRNGDKDPRGWTGSHSQRRKVISFIAEYGCDAPTVKVQGQYNSRARCGRGRRYNSLSKAVSFSLFNSSKIIPSFQISCFLCLVFSKGQNISAGLCVCVCACV